MLTMLTLLWQVYRYGDARPEMMKVLFAMVWLMTLTFCWNSGFYHERIQWPDSMTLVMYLYYISLAVLQVAFYGLGLVGFLGVLDILPIYSNPVALKIVFALVLMAFPVSLSMLSQCWDLHDKWAERSGNERIGDYVSDTVKCHWQGLAFDTGAWVLIDLLLILMLWPIYMAFGQHIPLEDKWLICMGMIYTNFLILQGYLYVRYRKEGL